MEFVREAEGGFKDKWYAAKIIKILINGTSKTNVLVEYNKQKEPMVLTPSSATPSPQTILHALQPLKPPQSEAEKKKKNKNGENMEDNQTSEQWFFEEGNSAPSSSALKRVCRSSFSESQFIIAEICSFLFQRRKIRMIRPSSL
ncbi:hypothetical protein IFM89_017585 [Coptis chinensis]|uniref:Agenet domain-containing protein n=1 Tax=Coptis chinensis TaxID=261450 RepID=A0A835HTP5_9MAGN|nr:hypothetical protein IFM89_017585 [Coptis chinensis]